jgi:hypothetical protein
MFQRVSPSCLLSQYKGVSSGQIAVFLLNLGLLVMTGCSGSGSNPLSSAASQIQIAVSPSTATLSPSAQQQFTATVQGTTNSAVTWMASAGSISSNGTFTAPVANSGTQVTITASSVSDSTQRASSVVTIEPPAKLQITTSTLSGAIANTPYNAGVGVSGGTPPYKWSVSAGLLPQGFTLQGTTGAVAGSTSITGNFSFTVKVTDAASNSAAQSLILSVAPAVSGSFDGPAELPRVYLNTTLADTPAPGPVVTVAANADLQTALNNANCGDTLDLQAGATYSGQYIFPAKSCDDQHWIIVRTSSPDTTLPPEGTRMTPCYAGVSSLPGRPAFSCTSTKNVLAAISYAGTGNGPIMFASGANHYRLLGLEITRAANGKAVTDLIVRDGDGSMSQIVLDRVYIHGTPVEETRRGVDFSGGTSMAVQDSYISDIHCNTKGTCTDSQAVAGGAGDQPMGPYKIDDNFLEASGENILFGGSEATQTPQDIEIRFNHLFKPMLWLQGQPGYTAPTVIVKNHFEMKNAQRVLVDSNVLEDNWGGFTQHGASVLIGPKNPGGDDGAVCPLCQVTDVTIRYSTISHVAGAFVIDNGDAPGGGAPLAGERYSIHDVIADDINGTTYIGYGTFVQVGTVAQPLLQSVAINHVTAFPNRTMLSIGIPTTSPIPGFVFSNSIVAAAQNPVFSTGNYGSGNCAYHHAQPAESVTACFAQPVFSTNAFLGSTFPSSEWPAGNFFYSSSTVGFVNYNNGNGGDYHLVPSSPAIGAASDGTNLGANVDAVLTAVSGVR